MERYNFKIQLIRKDWIIEETEVQEFDDECVKQNVFIQAVDKFEYVVQDGDIIKTPFEKILVREENDGFHFVVIGG